VFATKADTQLGAPDRGLEDEVFESIGSVLSGIKQAGPVVLMGVAIATGIGVFATDGFIAQLGLLELRNQHRAYVGGVFIVSGAMLGAQGLAAVAQMARRRYRRHRLEAQSREALHALTPDEKAYLLPFVLGGQNTLYFRAQDGVAGGLIAKKILYQSSTIGSMLSGFAHNLQPWAREHLEKHPHLLEGANPSPEGPPRY
jgi:hypothetical protein